MIGTEEKKMKEKKPQTWFPSGGARLTQGSCAVTTLWREPLSRGNFKNFLAKGVVQ